MIPADTPGVLDYSTRQGIEIFKAATRSLYEDPADNYDVDAAGLQTFLGLLQHRGNISSWDFEVPRDVNDNLINLHNLLTNHGTFTLEHIKEFSDTYVHSKVRAAQMNMQIVKCILASLSLVGFRKVQTWHAQWHIKEVPCSLLLIKIIIREAYIDTQATTRILREHLSSLPVKLAEFKGDITQLNSFVIVTKDQLSARGETTTDLLANLFKGYLSSQDKNFREYMEKKQEDYDEGKDYTSESLMELASNKYKTLVENGKWMSKSPEEEKILALEAKLAKLTKPAASSNNTKTGQNKSNTSGTSSSGNKNNRRRSRNKEIAPWKLQFPGQAFISAGQPKIVNGRKYYWCHKHRMFTAHKSSECRLTAPIVRNPASSNSSNNAANNQTSSNANTNANSQPTSTPSIRVSTATMMDE